MTSQQIAARASALPGTSPTAPFDEGTLARLEAVLRTLGLDFDIAFYEVVRRHEPDHELALEALGHAYTQRGHFAAGLEVDRRLVELRPDDAIAHYNLACSYVLVGDTDLGIASLERAVDLGYADLEHLENDRDLDAIRGDRRFGEIVRRLTARRR